MSAGAAPAAVSAVAQTYSRIEANVAQAVQGKPEIVRLALVCLLAEGHLLVEDVPGVGKTMLSKSIGRSINCTVRRVQFTPDLLPSDITGTTVYNAESHDWEFKPGAVFANIVLGDEINRAGPKTQSALLEAMEEGTVTVDGTTHSLATPFMVIATQNPIEIDGTFALPEAQRDRFMMRVTIGYPTPDAEMKILNAHERGDAALKLQHVTTASDVAQLINVVKSIHCADALKAYVINIVRTTRQHPAVKLGCSPRAGLALLRAGRSWAATIGRDYVIPDDVKTLAPHVLSHRLILSPEALMAQATPEQVIADVVKSVPVPQR